MRGSRSAGIGTFQDFSFLSDTTGEWVVDAKRALLDSGTGPGPAPLHPPRPRAEGGVASATAMMPSHDDGGLMARTTTPTLTLTDSQRVVLSAAAQRQDLDAGAPDAKSLDAWRTTKPRKCHNPEEVVAKLRQVDVTMASPRPQGTPLAPVDKVPDPHWIAPMNAKPKWLADVVSYRVATRRAFCCGLPSRSCWTLMRRFGNPAVKRISRMPFQLKGGFAAC